MNKKRNSFLSIGIPSMCTIFAVLCLVILALLTLGTSRQDLQTSRLTLEQTTAYYTACKDATNKYHELINYAQKVFTDSEDQTAYNKGMFSIASQYPDVAWDQTEQVLSFTVKYTDEQSLSIEISIPYPTGQADLVPDILTWKTISTADWNPDIRQPVYKGDTK